MAAWHWASLPAPFFQKHILTLCLPNFGNSQNISNVFITVSVTVICDQRSLISLRSLFWGHHEPSPCNAGNLRKNICSDCSIYQPSPHLSPSPWASLFPNPEIRQTSNSRITSECSSERQSLTPKWLSFVQKVCWESRRTSRTSVNAKEKLVWFFN